MYLNLIARSVFALALTSAGAMACKEVAADPAGCGQATYVSEPHAFDLYKPSAPRVWRGEDGSKWTLAPSGYLVKKEPRITKGGWAYYMVFGIVTVADWHSTNRCHGAGRCREGNPMYAAANGGISNWKFFGVKGLSLGLSLSSDLYFKPKALAQGKRPSRAVPVVRWLVLGAQAVAVINNYAR